MRIVFAGTPDFASISLKALLQARHDLVAVLTQPDRPAGRGRKLLASPVKQLALEHHIPVRQPLRLNDKEVQTELAADRADVLVVVAYGLIIPPSVLAIPAHGCLNVHGSLLPRWRGAAPVQRALMAGDTETGVTIMQMDAGLDTGPMLHRVRTPIRAEDTGGSLHDRLALLGAGALVQVLADLPRFLAEAQAQPEEGVTYAHKLAKQDGKLDWRDSAEVLHNQIRALNPWPIAWTSLAGETLRLWSSRPGSTALSGMPVPGTIIAHHDDSLEVACGAGSLHLTHLQLPGGKSMKVADLLRGHADRFRVGRVFEHA